MVAYLVHTQEVIGSSPIPALLETSICDNACLSKTNCILFGCKGGGQFLSLSLKQIIYHMWGVTQEAEGCGLENREVGKTARGFKSLTSRLNFYMVC